jgi:hypothetical protein
MARLPPRHYTNGYCRQPTHASLPGLTSQIPGPPVLDNFLLEQIHVSWKHEFAPAFFSSHFRTENRIPLFLKVL